MNPDAPAVKKESTKTQLIQDAAVYIPSSYFAQGLGIVNAFLIRWLLGPTMMGLWATVQIILNYGGYLHLGSMQAGAKEIPFHMGRKDLAMAQKIQNNIFSFGLLSTSLGAVLLMLGAWLYSTKLSRPIFIGIMVAGLMLILQRIINVIVMLLRGHKNFALLSRLTIFTALIDVLLTGVLVWLFGLYGLYAAVLGSLILSIAFVWKRLPYPFSFALDRNVLRDLAPIALPMLALGIVFTLLRTVDKIMIVKYMGATQLGVYSVALMASNYVFGISNMMGMLTLPRYSEKFGNKGDVAILGGYMDEAHRVLGILLPVVLGALYFLVPVAIKLLLGKYTAGIPAMQVLLFGTFFLSLVNQPNNFLLAIGKQTLILPATAAGVVISVALNYWIVRGPKDIAYVAMATSLSYAVTFLLMFAICNRQYVRKTSAWVALGELFLPFAGVVVVVWGLDKAFDGIAQWWVIPVQMLLYGLVCIYPLTRLEAQTRMISKSCNVLRDKILAVVAARRSSHP